MLTVWFLRDLAWAENYYPENFIMFFLCTIFIFPATMLGKKGFISFMMLISVLSFLFDPRVLYSLFSVDAKLIKFFWFYLNFILSYIDVFVFSSVFLLLARSRSRLIAVPPSIVLGVALCYMIYSVYYRWDQNAYGNIVIVGLALGSVAVGIISISIDKLLSKIDRKTE